MTDSVQEVDRGHRKICYQVIVEVSAAELFSLLRDPAKHSEIDGSGTVGNIISGPSNLNLGDKFTVAMKQYGFPYRITSSVTELVNDDQKKVIEWQHPFKQKWRWELAVISDHQTLVTEVFDYSTAVTPRGIELAKFPVKNSEGIKRTLEGLAARYRK
ncbi:MAG: dimethyladenosine transferase [Mycobacteriaceae bacterium]